MIVGVDHIALSAPALAPAATALRGAGFEPGLSRDPLSDHPAKLPFLGRATAHHATAMYHAKQSVAVEVTVHAPMAVATAQSGYEVLLMSPAEDRGSAAAPAWPSEAWAAIGRHGAACAWPELGARYWRVAGPAAGVLAVAARVVDPERSIRFWTEGLALVPAPSASRTVRALRSASRFGPWSLDVLLHESPAAAEATLDAPGFPCLAFVSTDVPRDADRLARHASAVGETFDLRLGDRDLRLVFARGPSGELVELVGVLRAVRQ